MSSVRVIRPGMQTTVQDAGRWGWQSMGVSVAGAMDGMSYRVANAYAGNPVGTSVLEVAFTGPELEFEDERAIALAGALFALSINGTNVPTESTITVPAGGRLRFGARTTGARAYLAIEGGIEVPVVLDSRSTHMPGGFGGFKGRALAAGDVLPLGPRRTQSDSKVWPQSKVWLKPDTTYGKVESVPVLRVVPGRHVSRFVDGALASLESDSYVIAPESNRMGFRMQGARLEHRDNADIASEIMPMGSLQVPSSGQPILLMADRQTTGGYTVLANVITADLPVAAQLAPGDRVRFEVCDAVEAMRALSEQESRLAVLEQRQ